MVVTELIAWRSVENIDFLFDPVQTLTISYWFPIAYWAFPIAYWAFPIAYWAFPIAIGRSRLWIGRSGLPIDA